MAKVNKVVVNLENVRLSFANVFEPKSFNGSNPAYSANFLIPKTDVRTVEAIKQAITDLIKVQWPVNAPAFKEDKIAFKNGDNVSYDGYTDHFFVSSKNTLKPVLKDLQLNNLVAEDNKLISGDWVNARIEFWAQDNNFGKRINCNLVGIQFVKEGERFGGGTTGDIFKKQETVEEQEQKEEEAEIANIFGEAPKKLSFGSKK